MTAPVLLFPIVSDVFLDDFSRTFASAAVQRGFDIELVWGFSALCSTELCLTCNCKIYWVCIQLLPASIRVAGIHFVNQLSNPKIRTASFTLDGFADSIQGIVALSCVGCLFVMPFFMWNQLCVSDAAKQNRAALFLLRSKDLCSTHRQLLLSLSRFLQSSSGGLMPFVIDLEDAQYRNVVTTESGTEDVVSISEAQWTKFAEFQLPLVASRTFQLEQSDRVVVQQQFDEEIQGIVYFYFTVVLKKGLISYMNSFKTGPEPCLDNLAYDFLDANDSERPDLLKHYNQFVEYHEQQLTHMQLPQKLWKVLLYLSFLSF
jgi:hypothetical protein